MKCNQCGAPATLRCSRCKTVSYCGASCQKANWKSHKKACKAAAAMAELATLSNNKVKKIDDARRELEEARAMVERLKAEAEEAKVKLEIEKKESEELDGKVKEASNNVDKAMDAAPEYGDKEYWDRAYKDKNRYVTGNDDTYDWYFNDYDRMHPLFSSVFGGSGPQTTLVDVGCGNSPLLSNLLSSGVIDKGIGLDISPSVISQCRSQLPPSSPLTFHHHDLTSPLPPSISPPSSLQGAVDKGTLDAILSGGTDAEKSTSALNDATFVILNVLSLLKAGGKFLIFTNLPPAMALSFFTSVNKDVVCVAAFDPNGSDPVKPGSGLSDSSDTQTTSRVKTVDGREITASKNIHVYKLTKGTESTQANTRAQIEALKSLHASTVSTLKTIKDDGALGSTVTLARESLSQAKSSTGYDSLSSSVDAAAHQLAESVKQEMEGSKAAQEIADEV
ncbi:hypothetical protein TrRE_jg13600, partial [Triparma retinervis]